MLFDYVPITDYQELFNICFISGVILGVLVLFFSGNNLDK